MLFIILEFATILTSVEMDKVLGKSKRQILPQVSYVNFQVNDVKSWYFDALNPFIGYQQN